MVIATLIYSIFISVFVSILCIYVYILYVYSLFSPDLSHHIYWVFGFQMVTYFQIYFLGRWEIFNFRWSMSSFLMISNYSTQSWLYPNACWLNPGCLLLDRLHLLLFAWVKGTHFATMIEPFFVYTLFYLLGKSALFGLLSTKSSVSCLHPVPPKN